MKPIKGFRLLAIDGSVVTLPNTNDVKEEFNPMKVKCQIKEFLIWQPYIIHIHKYSKLLFQVVTSFFLQTQQVINLHLQSAFFVDYNKLRYIQI